jgi:pimeloyl-ACP methyl ester carboxylesterase
VIATETRGDWDLRLAGPPDAATTVLLIPGGMCTAGFYDDIYPHAVLAGARIRFVAATLPGFGPTRPLDPATIDHAVARYTELAAEIGADMVVGHSLGGNFAIEMAAGGGFSGGVVLLEPAFSREDEFAVLAKLDRIGRISGVGRLVWTLAIRTIKSQMTKELPPERAEVLGGEMNRSDPRFCRMLVRDYFAYLDRHGSVVGRLCDSGVRALVVFGDRTEVGLQPEERAALDTCPTVRFEMVADSGHMLMTDQPARIAELIRGFVAGEAA